MRQEPKTKVFKSGGEEFTLLFEQLRPSKSLKMLRWLGKILSGTAGGAVKSLNGSSIEELSKLTEDDIKLDKVCNIIFDLFDKVEEDELIEKLNLLFSSVEVNSEQLEVDHMMFQGETTLIFSVAKEALGVNFSGFFGETSSVFKKLKASIKIIKNYTTEQT